MSETRFIVLTKHPITLYEGSLVVRVLSPSGTVARLVDAQGASRVPALAGISAAVPTPLEARRLDGLPDPQPGVVYVTSILCLAAARAAGRYDVVAPDTDDGAVRDAAGQILGSTRLLLAGDPPPAYRAVFGSATYAPTANDTDVAGWSDAPVGREHRTIIGAPPVVQAGRDQSRPIDYHEIEPTRVGEEWVIRIPVWGEEDPSQPYLCWHSPTARPVRLERQVLRTGPAQIRRYAATGRQPDFRIGDPAVLPDHGTSGQLVVELRAGDDDLGYRGCGLLAWRRAFERLSVSRLVTLPAPARDLARALIEYKLEESDLVAIAERAEKAFAMHAPVTPDQHRDVAGTPAAAGNTVTLYWTGSEWRAPYASSGYPTFGDALTAWSVGA